MQHPRKKDFDTGFDVIVGPRERLMEFCGKPWLTALHAADADPVVLHTNESALKVTVAQKEAGWWGYHEYDVQPDQFVLRRIVSQVRGEIAGLFLQNY